MFDLSLPIVLSFTTLLIVVAVAVFLLMRARNSQASVARHRAASLDPPTRPRRGRFRIRVIPGHNMLVGPSSRPLPPTGALHILSSSCPAQQLCVLG